MQTQSSHSIFLDWLRFTVPVDTKNCELLPPHKVFDHSGEVLTPHKNYNQALGLVAGRVDWHTEQPEQRKMVTLTGDDLLRSRREGVTDDMLLTWVAAFQNINVTRLDVAIDTRNKAIQPSLVYRAWSAGKLVTNAKKVTRIEGKDAEGKGDGYTVYVGSRSSEQFLRVYDKNAEQRARGATLDNPDELWTRVELELKGVKARVALRAIAKAKIKNAGAIIGQFLDWPENVIWQDIVSGNIEADLSVGRKETDHETWLRRVVFPQFMEALNSENPEAIKLVGEWLQRRKLSTRR